MLPLVLAALLCAKVPVQEPAPAPDPARVQAAVQKLGEAFARGKTPERIQAIQEAAQLEDGKVVDAIGKGLKDSDPKVQEAAIEALRFLRHPDSLKALHACLQKDRKIREDEQQCARLIKAIAHHQSRTSVAILSEDPWSSPGAPTVKARILGLGMIRCNESVEALMGLMKVAGRFKVQTHMDDFQLALMVLTGVDQGQSQEAWTAWWNNNKKDYQVAPKPQALPKLMQARWDYYWGLEHVRERPEKRPDRGKREGEKKAGDSRP